MTIASTDFSSSWPGPFSINSKQTQVLLSQTGQWDCHKVRKWQGFLCNYYLRGLLICPSSLPLFPKSPFSFPFMYSVSLSFFSFVLALQPLQAFTSKHTPIPWRSLFASHPHDHNLLLQGFHCPKEQCLPRSRTVVLFEWNMRLPSGGSQANELAHKGRVLN